MDSTSGQKAGESLGNFIVRRAKRRSERLTRKSKEERQRREQRMALVEITMCPDAEGPKAFEWEEEQIDVPIRCYIHGSEVPRRWPLYAQSQKHYDSFFNEFTGQIVAEDLLPKKEKVLVFKNRWAQTLISTFGPGTFGDKALLVGQP